MGARGPAPKDPEKRVRRNKEVRTSLPAAPPVTSRVLPPAPPVVDEVWSAFTRSWWDSWCSSAQASRFTAPAWRRLEMLAVQVELYWRSGDTKHLAEIRMQETALGALPMDLARLRWDLEEKPATAKVRDDLAAKRSHRRVVDDAVAGG